jgi:D-glycero-D-manno-heptose 1,7-bisphosphate phosphatase
MFAGLFLDRDGVIIQHRIDYVRTWEDVNFIPGSLEALARLQTSPYRIAIITNQSAIGRGLILPETAAEINRRLADEIARAGGRIDGIFMCPHRPEDHCTCRKPHPGLLLQAAEGLKINLAESILIGDNLTDLLAGQAAGITRLALVKTGLGNQQLASAIPETLVTDPKSQPTTELKYLPAFAVFSDLFTALHNLIP